MSTSQKRSEAIVYSREGCHLCDEAVKVLHQHKLSVTEVDIDQDSDLQRRFDTCVPVVVIDGRERFRGRVNPILLKRLLRGSAQE